MNKMIKKPASRISFSDYDATHLYELALEHFLVSGKEGVCHVCLQIKTRLEKMIGKKEVARVKRQVKQHPYNITSVSVNRVTLCGANGLE